MSDKNPVKVKLTVGKGLSKEVAKDLWRKVDYRLELEIDVKEIQQVEAWKEKAEATIDGWLAPHTGKLSRVASEGLGEAININDIPNIDLAELEAAGWQTFQKKPCRPGESGWVKNPVEFTSWRDPPQVLLRLVKAIHKTADKKLVLGDLEYFLSKKFINRKPAKRESARR